MDFSLFRQAVLFQLPVQGRAIDSNPRSSRNLLFHPGSGDIEKKFFADSKVSTGFMIASLESTKNCGAHLMLQVRTRTLDGTRRGSSSRGIGLKAGARAVAAEPCAA